MNASEPRLGPACETCVMTVVVDADRFWCAVMGRTIAERAGLSARSCWEVAIAVSELVSNTVKYAGTGEVRLVRHAGPRPAIELEVHDEGPGIANPERALVDGYSEQPSTEARPRSLGLGLGAVRRMMNTFELHSTVGRGTRVRAVKWDG
jgi:serine/threonine-protein kinase RsbT